ncbi:APC family permease [Kineococcus sp. NBC_00420]|uniref:APC family permease n=1 Tax=Kineococcus sp. NBC_00420 TaxID=2903564 RepID=UPI002E1F073F
MTVETRTPALRRVLNLRYLVVFGLAYLAPTVVFDQFGITSDLTGGMQTLAVLITTVAMSFTAYSYSLMVRAHPVAGSAYTYVQRSVNPWLGFFTGWVMLLDYLLLPMICYLLLGTYLNAFVPGVPVALWVVAGAVFVAVFNVIGVRAAGRINIAVVVAQVVFSAVFAIVLVVVILRAQGTTGLIDTHALVNPDTFDTGNVLRGASVLAVSFLGFDAVSTFAEETVEPRKTVPRAVMIVCVGGGAGFAVMAYLLQTAWPTSVSDMVDPNVGILELIAHTGTSWIEVPFLVVDNVSTIVCAMAAVAAVSRVLLGMGRDDVLPRRFFGRVDARFQTPVRNILATSVISLSAIFYADDLLGAASLVSFGAITGFVLVNYAAINHYFVRGGRRHGADVLKFLVLPGLGVLVTVVLWVGIDAHAKELGLVWLGLGLVYIGVKTRGFRRPPAPLALQDAD